MSESTLDTLETDTSVKRVFRNPLDPPIRYVAHRFGGNKPKELERFLKFAVVGVSGAVVDFGILIGLQATILPPERPLNVAIATIIAFITAVISNFTWTRLWVYPESRSRSIRRQLTQFTIISVTGGVARTIWITSTYYQIGHALMPIALPFIKFLKPQYTPSQLAEESLGSIVAQLIAMVVVMLWNFFANRYWTYNDVD